MSHVHEKIDFCADVFIVYKNKVLLRKHDKYKIWLSVGGHIELDEDPTQAAVREVKEEVGLDVKLDDSLLPIHKGDETIELIPPYYLNKHQVDSTHDHITFVYFAASDTGQLQLSETEKSDEARWFTKEELDTIPLRENIKFYALKALEKLGE